MDKRFLFHSKISFGCFLYMYMFMHYVFFATSRRISIRSSFRPHDTRSKSVVAMEMKPPWSNVGGSQPTLPGLHANRKRPYPYAVHAVSAREGMGGTKACPVRANHEAPFSTRVIRAKVAVTHDVKTSFGRFEALQCWQFFIYDMTLLNTVQYILDLGFRCLHV